MINQQMLDDLRQLLHKWDIFIEKYNRDLDNSPENQLDIHRQIKDINERIEALIKKLHI